MTCASGRPRRPRPTAPSSSRQGPFCYPGQGGAIDPSPYVDTDGVGYLTFKTEGDGDPYVPTRIWSVRLSADRTSIVTNTEHQLLETLPPGAGTWEYPIVEGPTFLRAPDQQLYLFYSAYNWYSEDYKVGVAKCDTGSGPCTRIYSTPVLASRGTMLGPGGQMPFRAVDGSWRLAFHAWTAGDLHASSIDGSKRALRTLPITFPAGGPKIG